MYGPFIVQVPVEAMAIMTLTTALNSVLRSANMGVKLTDVALEIAALVEAETHVLSMKKNKEIPHWQKRAANNKPTSSRELSAFTKRLRKMAPIVEKDWPQDVKVGFYTFYVHVYTCIVLLCFSPSFSLIFHLFSRFFSLFLEG